MRAAFLCRHSLFSRPVARQVFSAIVSLTSVFGMGTGGPSRQSTPTAKKKPDRNQVSLCWHYLFSRSVTRQVSSAHVSLTSVFGMGTGGPSHQSAPTIYMLTTFRSITAYQHARAFKKGGDPYRIRTDVKGVRGLCLNHLTNGPACLYEAEDRLYTWSAFRDSNPGPTD